MSEQDISAKLAELDEQLAKFEAQKRWSDVIKTVLAKAELHTDPAEKVALYAQAGTMYLEKSSNQAEAIKAFEQVLELDRGNIEAITRLKEMYEKRRDWEKLVGVMRTEAELLEPDDRALRYVEMAQLATERLRKPEICIDLWKKVIEFDPQNPDALGALGGLYEKAREWAPLADVLEKQSETITDQTALLALLQKLGMIYADKLTDDAGAVRAFQRVLQIDPNERRAQEQLKKKYVALKAWDDLEAFYTTGDKWDELIRTLERESEQKEITDAERTDLLFRVARLWMTQKGKVDRAAKSYEKVLEIDPKSLEAANALTPIYEQANDSKKLAGVYEVRLGHLRTAVADGSAEPAEFVMLLQEAGLLYEEKLKDGKTAFERFLEAFGVDPQQSVVREHVERVAAAVQGWDRVVAAFELAIERTAVEDEQIELRMHFGRVLGSIDRVDEAIAQLRAVYDVRSDHAEALTILEGLYRQKGRFKDLLEVYTRRAELESDPDTRKKLAYDMAALREVELADPDEAIEAYRGILSEYGDDELDAYAALDRLYEARGKWQDLADALERRITLGPATDEALASLKFRLGRALELHLGQKAQAVEHYREILSLVPEHDGAREALEALLADAEHGGRAAEILEPIYEVRGDWEPLVRALEVLLVHAEDPARKLEILTKIGMILSEQVQDAGRAFDAFGRGLRVVPESEDTLARLEMLAGEQARWGELVALVSELAGASQDPQLSRTLWLKAAQIHQLTYDEIVQSSPETAGQSVDAAVAAYSKILDQDAGDLEVLGALEALYQRTERWRDLLGVLRKRIDLSGDPTEQEELLARMAQIHDEQLSEPTEAITLYREILELDPTSQRGLAALDGLFERQQLWSELADNVGRQLTLATEPEQQTALMLRQADLREKRMGAVDAAIDIYRQVLEREPSNEAALTNLERLMQDAAHELAIAEILEPLYRDANEFQKLVGVHEIQVRHAASEEQRVELLHRIAELHEVALDDLGAAFRSFARALDEDPSSESSQEALERLARTTNDFEALAQVYEAQLTKLSTPAEGADAPTSDAAQLAAALGVKAAQVREEQLGDAPRAIAHYQKVLELDPAHLESASALERLFHQTERYDDLAKISLTKSKMLDVPDEQKDYLFRAASIYEELLERPADAIAVYHQVLDVDPEELRALDKLIELYLRLGNWEKLLEINAKKVDIVDDPDEKKRLLVEAGAVWERELGNTQKAIDTYSRILELDPGDPMALGRLDALYQATENWQELLGVLDRESQLAGDPSEVISYRFRIADLWDHKLGDAPRAVDGYREILDVQPDHEPTLNALEALVSEGREPVSAAGVLEPVYRSAGEFAKLIAVHEVQIKYESDASRKVELFHQVAELYETQLDQVRAAFDAFARALPFDAFHETTQASLERLAEQLNAWGEVTKLYDTEIEKLAAAAKEGNESPDKVVELGMRVAALYEVQVGDVDAAIARYRLVLEHDATQAQAIERLDALYESTEKWAELAEILLTEIQTAPSPDDVLGFQYRLGQVYQARLGDVDKAIEQYKGILEAAPEHQGALEALESLFAEGIRPLVIGQILEPLYRMQEAWDKLIGVETVELQYEAGTEQRIAMMHKIAENAEERAADPATAFAWYRRAFLEGATNERTAEEIERLARLMAESGADGWQDLAHTYADALEAATAADVKVSVGKKLARVYAEELGDTANAEETYRYVLAANGQDAETLEALDRIYTEVGAHEALAEVLRKRVAATSDKRELIELSYRLGQTYDIELARYPQAIETYRRVIEQLDPQHADAIRSLAQIYTLEEDWPNLFATFQKELEVASGDSGRSEVLAKMARLASDKLGQPNKAIELWTQVLDLRGEDLEALNALGDIHAQLGNWKELVGILEREVNESPDDATRVAIYTDLGRIFYEKLKKDRDSLDAWTRVLDLDPSNTGALFAMATIHRASAQWSELVDVLHRIIDVGATTLEDAVLEDVYMQLGELYEKTLTQPMDAVDAYRHALDLNVRNFTAMDALERIHTAESQWEDCIGIKERRYEALEDPKEQVRVLLDIAKMWEEPFGDKDRGTSAFERVLTLEPLHDLAFKQLEALHKENFRWEPLISLYVTRVEATEDVAERVALLRRVSEVYENELENKGEAFDMMSLAWQTDFTDKEVAKELERLAAQTQKWQELLATANEAFSAVEDPQLKIAIGLKCAKWYGQELRVPEYAIPYYQQILTLDPTNVPALRQMAELYRLTQQWQALGQTLLRVVDLTNDPAEKQEVYVELGEVTEKQLGQPDAALRFYTQAAEINAAHLGAIEKLERVFKERSMWPELLDIQRRRLTAVMEPEEVVKAKLQVAENYELRLQDLEKAIETYAEVREVDPQNLEALKGLERLYTLKERWPDLVTVLEAEFEVVQTEKERITILTRLASMWEELFVKPDKAAARLEQIVDIDPSHDASLRGLARLYRQMQRWDDLIGTYERHINATPDRREKVDLYKQIGQVWSVERSDVDRAIDAYLNILSIAPDDVEALDALAKLYEKREDFPSALDMMGQLARKLAEPQQVVDLRFRMGKLLDEKLGDRSSAVVEYQSALDVEPGHLPSLEAMRKIHIDNGDWLSASRTLEQETQYQTNARQVSKLLVELGGIYATQLDEPDRAIEVYESAYKQDSDNEDAALPLVDEYTKQERWADAKPLLEMLVKRANRRSPDEQHRLWFLLGSAAEKLGDEELALKGFEKANALDAQHLPSLQGLAAVYYRTKDWEKAFKFYQMILVHNRDALAPDDVTETFYRLGVIKREQSDRRKALNMFDKALEADPRHRPTLEAVVGLHEAANEWEQVIHFKKQILEDATPEERFKLLDQIGDHWKEKLKQPQKAIQSYDEASELQPKNHIVLHKMLQLFMETKQFEKAIEIIQKIADLSERAAEKAKYAYTIGVIYRDELKNVELASQKFDEALDADPSNLKPFEAINKIFTTKKDWKNLERAYRKLLKRIMGKGNDELEYTLLYQLGVIYRDRQQQYEQAADVFKMASAKKPDDQTVHQILAELYALVPSRIGDAIAEHQYLLSQDAYRVDSYRALYKLYFDARQYDKAWCLASTLNFLKKADAEQQQFYEQYRVKGMIRPQNKLDNERWVKDVFHPDEDFLVGKMFECVAGAVYAMRAQPDKALNLNKKQLVDPATSTVTFVKTFAWAAHWLNLPVPRLFLVPDQPGALDYKQAAEGQATVCGATLLQGFAPQDLAFLSAKHLAYYRGEHYIRRLLLTQNELKLALVAALRVVNMAPADPTVDASAAQIAQRMQPVQMEALRQVAKRFVESGGRSDIKKWMQGVELTACRAGFVIANDLEIAARLIAQEPAQGPQDLPPKEKVKELVLYSVSEQYFRVREALGITINIG